MLVKQRAQPALFWRWSSYGYLGLFLMFLSAIPSCFMSNTVGESEAISVIKLALKAQESYWVENNQFAISGKQLSTVFPSDSQFWKFNSPEQEYHYELMVPSGRPNVIEIKATPKNRGVLRSFTGVLAIVEIGNLTQFKPEICGTDTPSRTPPPVSIASIGKYDSTRCPPGSRSVF
jgi:hypothetical protein